jgi:hypothetical protein
LSERILSKKDTGGFIEQATPHVALAAENTVSTTSPLPLFVAGISTDDEHNASATDNLTFLTDATDAGANLHTRVRGDGRPRL